MALLSLSWISLWDGLPPFTTLWGCLPLSLFLADILKKVIREYKDVYSEIVNRAGRTLQQVWGGAQRGEDQFPYPPSPPTLC